MKSFIARVVLFAGLIGSANAALIRFHTMSELTHNQELADLIVLCEETEVRVIEIPRKGWVEQMTHVRCRATRVFKGALEPGAEFEAVYGSLFRRSTRPRDIQMNSDGSISRIIEADTFPPGRALVFLQDPSLRPHLIREEFHRTTNTFYVTTAKLMRNGEVFEFGQFEGNPGGLSLRRKYPEWLQLAPNQTYGEAELVADLLLSFERVTPPSLIYYPEMKAYRPHEGWVKTCLQVAAYVIANVLLISAGVSVLKRRKTLTASTT